MQPKIILTDGTEFDCNFCGVSSTGVIYIDLLNTTMLGAITAFGDKEKVSKIKTILDEYQIPYWIDKEGIFSGENYKEVIVDAIDVAKVVIFMSSANSNASINVIRELGYAVQQRKTIIPVLLDNAQYAKSIRLDISDIDQIEFKDAEIAKKKLVASLAYSIEM